MAKQKSLAAEVSQDDAVQKIQNQIQNIQDQIARKQQALDSFQSQIQQRQAQADRLKEQAGEELVKGGDPLAVLDEAGALEYQLQGMQSLADESEPSESEYQQIEQLKKDLAHAVRRAINSSQALEQYRLQFEDKFREIKTLLEDFSATERAAFDQYRVQSQGVSPLRIRDKHLARYVRAMVDHI
ncbi:MAG: hypothetical protein U5L00_11360 [Desulfovermiculus sp.]|nr:hypothetical protein [Desulfovermiculus sp.]